jgi:deoxyribodipyrimidine photolyase-related protein
MAKAFIVLPNQLLKKLPPKTFDLILLVEDGRFFSDFQFHKKKLIFHRAGLKYYQQLLRSKSYNVSYIEHKTLIKYKSIGNWLKKHKVKHITLYDPVDNILKKRLRRNLKEFDISLELLNSPLFLCSEEYIKNYFADKKHYSMNSFYISQRKSLRILLEDGKPKGGKWSFDTANRQRLTKNVNVPKVVFPKIGEYVKEATGYVEKNFADNPGSVDGFFYPVTHKQAEKWLKDFLECRLENFGPYEDAISTSERFLFHSLLSPLLNSGLLNIEKVLEQIIAYSEEIGVKLNSFEGFVRQIIGWREFVRALYILEGENQFKSNFWGFESKLPRQFYDGSTGIEPVDFTIKNVLKNAYAHHIERLMILGNFMLLCEIHPKEVYKWFMELFIDAYDWVMVPNIFGMSQYADGGLMTTKPYISSSNYIRKMSDFKTGPWCDVWDGLFWRFVYKHKKVFAGNPRMKIMAIRADRMPKDKMNEYIKKSETYLKRIY